MIFWNPTTNPIISFVNATIKEIYYWCLLILIEPTVAHTSLEFWYMCVCLQHTLPYGQRTISSYYWNNKNLFEVWLLWSELSRFIQSIWVINYFPIECNNAMYLHFSIMKTWKPRDLWTSMLLKDLSLSRKYQARVKPFNRTDTYARMHDTFFSSSFLFHS